MSLLWSSCMPHTFNIFGTPTGSSPNPREHVTNDDGYEVGLFHLSRTPASSCEQDHVEYHIPRGKGRDAEERAYVGSSMALSPMRQPSPPLLQAKRRSKSVEGLSFEADGTRDGTTPSRALRRSFGEGSSMTLQTTAAEMASDARACEEAKLWREQLLAAQQAPAAGAATLKE